MAKKEKELLNARTASVYASLQNATAAEDYPTDYDTQREDEFHALEDKTPAGQVDDYQQQRFQEIVKRNPEAPQEEPTAQDVQENHGRKPRKGNYTAQEKAISMQNLNTQGKKGMRALRINMAFSPEIHDYIKVMSNVKGQTITEFVNEIMRQSLAQNRDTYEKAQELIRGLRSL